MNSQRATLHMTLAAYMSDNLNKQVLAMAKRVSRKTISKRTKATMLYVINCDAPAEMVKAVYTESSLSKKQD